MDIKDTTIEALLADLAVPDDRNTDLVGKWAAEQGIFPGQTRVMSSELYENYKLWHQTAQLGVKCPDIRVWGRDMTRRYQRGKAETGNFYYISREGVAVIPISLLEGAGASARGPHPVGPEHTKPGLKAEDD